MRVFDTLDQVEATAGQEVGTSDWLLVDQDRVDAFAAATGDDQWIHVDTERAAAGPFGGTVAHGYLTLAMLPHLSRSVYEFRTPGAKLNYGVNKVRFPTPLLVGKRIRAHLSFGDVTRVAAGLQVVVQHHVEIEDQAKPAMVAESVVLLLG